jgi:hypothetical protein
MFTCIPGHRCDVFADGRPAGSGEALATKVTRLTEKLTKLKEEMGNLAVYKKQMLASLEPL